MKMISYSHAHETYHPKKGLICTLPRLGSEGFGTSKWLIAHLEVGQETGYVLGRTAVWDCFFFGGGDFYQFSAQPRNPSVPKTGP